MMLAPDGGALARPARRPLNAGGVAQDERLPVPVMLSEEVEVARAFMRENGGADVQENGRWLATRLNQSSRRCRCGGAFFALGSFGRGCIIPVQI